MATRQPEDLGTGRQFLCREPWENYYILRRGIMPCCYGSKAIAPMSEWRAAWNSPAIQEIRSYLARGKLSPYCLESLSCPIVQRQLGAHTRKAITGQPAPPASRTSPKPAPTARPLVLRAINRVLGGLPGRMYRRVKER
jgi:hypothetical protein